MKKKLIIGGIITVIILAIGAMIYASIVLNGKEKEEDKYFQELKIDELIEKCENKESFILVISQTTCSHCAEYKPRFKKILAKHKITAYYLEKDLLNEEEEAKLNEIANISGTPTTVFIEEGVEPSTSTRLVGAKSSDSIESRLKAMGYIK